MTGTKIKRGPVAADAHNDELIGHAAKLAAWAGDALTSAADDLNDAHGYDRRPLTGLTQVVAEHASRVTRLADDIKSHSCAAPRPRGPQPTTRYTAVMD